MEAWNDPGIHVRGISARGQGWMEEAQGQVCASVRKEGPGGGPKGGTLQADWGQGRSSGDTQTPRDGQAWLFSSWPGSAGQLNP